MRNSRVLEKVRRDEPAVGIALHLTDPSVFEMAGLMGFDAVWMDMEHHFYSLETAASAMRAARVGGMDVVARPAKGEFARLSRMLEAGATGIMYPRCDNAAEAAEAVKWAKFAPLGRRGFDGSGPDVPYLMSPMLEYLHKANDETFLIIQLEDRDALAQAEAIAAVPGVDLLMFGPADYSILSGIPFEFGHPSIAEAIDRVATAARNTGKGWAATCGTVEQAGRMIEKGARLVFHGCDLVFVKNGLDAVRDSFAATLGLKIGPRHSASAGSYSEIRT